MTILYLVLIILVGSIIQGATGFGFAIFTMPFLAMLFPIKTTSIVVLVSTLILVSILFARTREHVNWRLIIPVVIASFIGRTIGIYALITVNDNLLRLILGIVLVAFSLNFIFGKDIHIKPSKRNGVIAGLASGVLGGMFNTAGPPLVVFYFAATSDKMEYQACFQATSLLSALYAVIVHLFYGNITVEVLQYSLMGVVAVVSGSIIGLRIFKMLNMTGLKRAISVLMAFMGIMIIMSR